MTNKLSILFIVLMSFTVVMAIIGQPQAPPSSNIFVADLTVRDGKMIVGKPVNITNRDGYNNQPSFMPDGKSVLYTSIREDKQADIYRHDLAKSTEANVTNTKESEYSPTLMLDGKSISVIRVEADQTQRLWSFPLSGGQPSLVIEKVKPVGYHAWIDADNLALFVLGSPSTLQLYNMKTQQAETVASDIGRSLFKVPGQMKVSFTQKIAGNQWEINELDVKTKAISKITTTQIGNEYYAWTPSGVLMTANNGKLFTFKPGTDTEWREIADLSSASVKGITRLAVSPSGDKIAMVADRSK